ncbi:MAG: WD40/YVTN/BNR-like repeat-containing protein [Patiriisocius sp.]|uniref:WD40/YVTN/BNR-like repeat-containing protein n=1 Tax=Patiriisocius sp. TaxID=2822396 RepID=UPI003EF8C43D
MRFIFFLLSIILFISCTSETRQPFISVTITEILSDSLSVRALAPQDANSVWFAANRGVVGLLDGKIPKIATVKYEEKVLNFRAIAKTEKAFFVLSIENPAVLYKMDVANNEAQNMTEVYVENGEGVFYDAMNFWNEKEGIAMGDPINGCLSILITRDGGNTWNKLSCDVLPPIIEGEAAFAASNSNIAIVDDHAWIATGGKRARVFHSADKGKTWEVFNTPIVQGKIMTGIYSIDFFDETTGVIFGGDWEQQDFNEGNKAITKDGGKTWQLLSNGKGPGYRSSVKFVPNTNGQWLVAVGSPGISYSDNKGEDWVELSSEGFYAIEFVNDSIAFASGNNKISRLVFE